jgi:5'-phosphate synthase pdxT subunit
MATEVRHPKQESLGLMDLTVERNAYGRQIDSRIVQLELDGERLEAVFIRAPIIRETGDNVRVLIEYQGHPVLVEQGQHMAATFHPELTSDNRIHEHFINKLFINKPRPSSLVATAHHPPEVSSASEYLR